MLENDAIANVYDPKRCDLHPLTELPWVASKWEELNFLRHDDITVNFVGCDSNAMSQRLKLIRERAKWHHISVGTTNKNAYIERRERKFKGRELWVICSRQISILWV
jgi:hypothetical protein